MATAQESPERRHLISAAKVLIGELKKQPCHASLAIIEKPGPATSVKSDGWEVQIASWNGHPDIYLWLDRYLGGTARRFWFGFWSRREKAIKSIVDLVPKSLIPLPHIYTDDDYEKDKFGIEKLKKPPTDLELTHSIQETYRRSFFFGMYDVGKRGSQSNPTLDALRAANFIVAVVNSTCGTGDEIERSEGGIRHVRLEQRIRNSALAIECKKRDKFRCRVCSFHFEEVYGRKYGAGFAEAHHIIPLNQLRTETLIRPSDLVTVCANCHRMLHRMSGKNDDFKRLRSICENRRSKR